MYSCGSGYYPVTVPLAKLNGLHDEHGAIEKGFPFPQLSSIRYSRPQDQYGINTGFVDRWWIGLERVLKNPREYRSKINIHPRY